MKNQSIVVPIFSSVIIFMAGVFFVSGCNSQNGSSNEETSMSEKAGTLRTDQQKEILRERTDTARTRRPAFHATLASFNEGPQQDIGATGTIIINLQNDSIYVKGEFSDLSSPYSGSAIHKVLEGEEVQTLNPTLNNNRTSGSWEGSYKLDEDQVTALKSDSLYISVYTDKYESGEIRGQITAVDSTDTAANSANE